MAKFYLNDIPKAPTGVSRAPIGATPAERKGPAPQYAQITGKVANIDIAKNIPNLMQKGLPENMEQALVGGQLRVGAAWGRAAESLAGVAETAGQIAGALQHSKDIADKSRYKNLMSLNETWFNEKATNEQWTAQQKLEMAPSWHDKLGEDIAKLGLSPDNAEQARIDLELFRGKHLTDLTDGMRKEQIASDRAAIDTRIRSATSVGDIDGALDAIEDAFDAQHINAGEREKLIYDAKVGFDEYKAQADIGNNPRAALDILENDVRTGKSDAYPNLPLSSINQLRKQAFAAVEQNELEAIHSIENGIASGTLKTDIDIDNAAGGNIEARIVDKLKQSLVTEPVYNPETMSKIEVAIDSYVKEPSGSGSPQYRAIKDMIREGAPKDQWSDLNDRLDKKRDKSKEALPGKDWFPEFLNEFTDMAETGRFIPKEARWSWDPRGPAAAFTMEDLKDPEWVNKPENKAQKDAMWDRVRSMQILMRKWRAKPENSADDEQTVKRAREYQNELLNLDSSQAGREVIRKELTPQLPETGVMGTKPTSSLGPESRISNPSLIAERQQIMSELDSNPATKRLAMQMLDTEGGGVATMEALVNRTAMIRQRIPGWTLWDELNSGFYGPINRGYAQTLKLHPGTVAKYQQHIDVVRSGSNVIRGRTDQGYKGDPNWQGPGRVHVADNPKEIYNFWTGSRKVGGRKIEFSHEDAARFASSYG